METKTSLLNHHKRWTDEEVTILQELWGNVPIAYIANKLNRTTIAIHKKADKLKLGAFIDNGDYVSYKQLLEVLGVTYNSSNRLTWITNRNFPVKKKKVINSYRKVVYLDEFWQWAEKNQDILDFSKLEYLILGKEPEWVDKKRKSDSVRTNTIKTTAWTNYEDNQLLNLIKEYKYTIKELSNILHRTESAINRRLEKLNCKYRPVPEPKHNDWTDEEVSILLKALKEETNWTAIKQLIPNHSEKGIKGKCYIMFKTQKLNNIKKLLSE